MTVDQQNWKKHVKTTLECAYCGHEFSMKFKDFENLIESKVNIQCKCGKWMIKNGRLGEG